MLIYFARFDYHPLNKGHMTTLVRCMNDHGKQHNFMNEIYE